METQKQSEFEMLLESAGYAAIADRGFLRITGPDATRWLNGMVSNSIQALQPGEGNYNFLLNAQGRIQGDAMVYRETEVDEPVFLVESDKTQMDGIQQHLDRFIIMDDVELALVEGLKGILVAGPQALSVVMALGTANQRSTPCSSPVPAPAPASFSPNLKKTAYAGATVWLIRVPGPLIPRFEIWSDSTTIDSILEELAGSGARPVSATELEWLRLLEGRPRYGVDIRDRDLPQETAQTHALHFAKGCYLGQEIVERIRSRGQVHRRFMAFRLTGELPTSFPTPLEAGGKAAGELTSAGMVPLAGGSALIALGYARQEALDAGQELTYAGGVAVPGRDPSPAR
ncbi:MAG: folate-binding protein [Acidobacteriaceae bacterium]